MTIVDLPRAAWRKSTYSGRNGNCTEVAVQGAVVGVLRVLIHQALAVDGPAGPSGGDVVGHVPDATA